ncbi:MAG: peroxiredoxin Q/BCP [Candidatus Peregrinibacteria bacterium Greene0416_62]|nr:MAG: peroxiredoxin Q/BCP [Candidatus Peregrinibacteria bacterium Greene0416_62]TSC98129.1 MAG: peroxiredoxin Q/BCP [Candidatus Peregrinibacteria bacterium Greene1014_49]
MLHLGDPAPAFSASDQDGKIHTLHAYSGRWLLLYFYPKDDTPGCTIEACGFRDQYTEISKQVVILGVSKDTIESHQRFAKKFALPFPLLTDPDRVIITAYGADGEIFPKRVSFLIDSQGSIAKIYDNIDCGSHAQEVRRDIAEFVGSP